MPLILFPVSMAYQQEMRLSKSRMISESHMTTKNGRYRNREIDCYHKEKRKIGAVKY